MFKKLLATSFVLLFGNYLFAAQGLVSLKSDNDFNHTVQRLEQALIEKGVNIFGIVDHSNGAANVELELRPTTLFLIGDPALGTPLMQCVQTAAIDLPQKLLVWEDENGQTWVSYNEPEYTVKRHDKRCYNSVATIETMEKALHNFALAASTSLNN